MKLHTIIGLFISAGLVLTAGAGAIIGYYYNKQNQTVYSDGEVINEDVYLNMLPGQQKDFVIDVDFAWSSDVNTSLWFSDADEYANKYVYFSAKKGEQLLFLDDDGNNVHTIKNYSENEPLKDKTYVGKDNNQFILTFYLSNDMVEEELDMQFTFNMKFTKTI